MNITVKKVIRKLEAEYGWVDMAASNDKILFIEDLIKDTISVINDTLLEQKGISIKKKKS